jgi:hypothetical protein
VTNPFFPGTYQLTIYGQNPNYQSPSGEYVVQIGSPTHMVYQSTMAINDVYVNGYADGLNAQQNSEINAMYMYYSECNDGSNFVDASTSTFDMPTCLDTVSQIYEDLYELQYSTPPSVPTLLP